MKNNRSKGYCCHGITLMKKCDACGRDAGIDFDMIEVPFLMDGIRCSIECPDWPTLTAHAEGIRQASDTRAYLTIYSEKQDEPLNMEHSVILERDGSTRFFSVPPATF